MATGDRRGPNRRQLVQTGAALAVAAVTPRSAAASPNARAVLRWLGNAPAKVVGEVVWGTPWPCGALSRDTSFRVMTAGKSVPVQSWPLAYWPDGTLKWTGHAAAGPIEAGMLEISPGRTPQPARPVRVRQSSSVVVLSSGDFVCEFPKTGSALIASVRQGSIEQVRNLRLVCTREDRTQPDVLHSEHFESRVERVVVEQAGPVRGVVRIAGRHVGVGGRAWLPFTVRVSLNAGGHQLRIVHSFVFDGDAATDFISSLGLSFEVPLRDELHNRHVRFAGAGSGLWAEAVRNLPGWTNKFALASRFPMQVRRLQGPQVLAPLDEVSWMETNHASQWSLNLIELMGMVGAYAPDELPAAWRSVP